MRFKVRLNCSNSILSETLQNKLLPLVVTKKVRKQRMLMCNYAKIIRKWKEKIFIAIVIVKIHFLKWTKLLIIGNDSNMSIFRYSWACSLSKLQAAKRGIMQSEENRYFFDAIWNCTFKVMLEWSNCRNFANRYKYLNLLNGIKNPFTELK